MADTETPSAPPPPPPHDLEDDLSGEDAPAAEAEAEAPVALAANGAPLSTWIQCDSCDKWRRVPESYASTLGDGQW